MYHQLCKDCFISIHTPARGVTRPDKIRLDKVRISIHTPARGVTCGGSSPINSTNYFNPHSRKGSDGAYQMKRVGIYDFNPHSRKGSDPNNTT